jgi:alpha,alpha-trehalase
VFTKEGRVEAAKEPEREEGYIAQRFRVGLSEGGEARVEKVVALFTSRDKACSECGLEAAKSARRAGDFDDLLQTHILSWQHLWERFEMDFELEEGRNDYAGMLRHLNIFHLLQTSSMHTINLDAGVPSRGWHGEAYRGHIFWDELFIFPFLNLRMPEITRSLLMYRYRRLPEARAAAREAGFRGAMYPWQSGSNGREESQQVHLNPRSGRWVPDHSRLQRHVNAAIAYNICQYYEATGDLEFMSFYGARILLEIARFWASIATYNDGLDRFEILGVMGPDEYHDGFPGSEKPGLDNNAYTNVMAVWVLVEALKVLDLLPAERREELVKELGLQTGEVEHWKQVSRKMRIVFHGDGIISQFEGYDRLKEFDWEAYRRKYGDIQRLDRILESEEDSTNRYKLSKQADVLMLFYLFSAEELVRLFERLGYRFDPGSIPKNIEYYLKRTSHGSTLSRVVHSWVLARSDRARSWDLCMRALESDLTDIQGGTTPEGIHLGAMAGSVNILQECYTGLEPRDDVLWFNPCLPEALNRLRMEIRYHGFCLEVEVTRERFAVSSGPCLQKPIRIGFNKRVYELRAEETRSFRLR